MEYSSGMRFQQVGGLGAPFPPALNKSFAAMHRNSTYWESITCCHCGGQALRKMPHTLDYTVHGWILVARLSASVTVFVLKVAVGRVMNSEGADIDGTCGKVTNLPPSVSLAAEMEAPDLSFLSPRLFSISYICQITTRHLSDNYQTSVR
jgi:hypothetical protein